MRKRRDNTHSQMLKDLRKMGYSIQDTADVGGGFGDMVIARGRNTALLEAKTPNGRKTARKLRSASQRKFAKGWKGVIICAFDAFEAHTAFNEVFNG